MSAVVRSKRLRLIVRRGAGWGRAVGSTANQWTPPRTVEMCLRIRACVRAFRLHGPRLLPLSACPKASRILASCSDPFFGLPKHNGGSDFEITRGKRKEKKGRKGAERGGKRGGGGAGRVGGMWGDHRGDLGLSGCAVGVSGRRRDGLRGPWESRLHCQRLVWDAPACSLAAGNMPGRPGHKGLNSSSCVASIF